ncbi:MAG TPA: serine hydrolase [Longimicrobiaceae bacterium]|nr:serine hydrolase [Longimicrobiaceae bacterium]
MSRRTRTGRRLALAAALTLIATSLPAQVAPPPGLDQEVARALREFSVPGLAIGIVKDGEVVLLEGYGVRRMGDTASVTPRTLFQIASNTKAFTSAALAMLVDSGKVSWDDRVIEHLPWFRLHDPYVTHELTIRDLLSHRSGLGLGGGDLTWYRSTYQPREVLERIRALPPTSSFRTTYAYQNIPFLAAGEVVPAVTGQPWDDFVRQRILQPLGMTSTLALARDLPQGGDVAFPHSAFQGELRVVPRDNMDNAAPAGSLVSNAADLAKWMVVQLDSGRVDGTRRLWSPQRTREMWSGQTVLPIGGAAPGLEAYVPNFSEIGLGWFLRDYRGHKLLTHTGGLAGMTSRTLLVPDRKLGIVILTNAESSAHTALAWWILDRYLGAPQTDWTAAFVASARRGRERAAEVERQAAAARVRNTRPSVALERYAGPYADPLYGNATLARENGRLVLRFGASPAFVADLEHWHHDTFVARWRERTIPDAWVTFTLDPRGAVSAFTMEAVSPLADFSFDYQNLRFVPVRTN